MARLSHWLIRMEDYLKKVEAQVHEWEEKIAHKLEAHETWALKRAELDKRICDVRASGAEQWALLKTGIEVAWEDLRQTYESMVEAARRGQDATPDSRESASGNGSPRDQDAVH